MRVQTSHFEKNLIAAKFKQIISMLELVPDAQNVGSISVSVTVPQGGAPSHHKPEAILQRTNEFSSVVLKSPRTMTDTSPNVPASSKTFRTNSSFAMTFSPPSSNAQGQP